jgi:hypothetical protein
MHQSEALKARRSNHMNFVRTLFVSALLLALALGQATPPRDSSYLQQAAITETAGAVRITANSPRPLLQVLDALRQKYGWVVDYEDPWYASARDIVKSKQETPGTLLPAGGNFTVLLPVDTTQEDQTLRLIVDAYNQSSNPGRFAMRRSVEGRFYVVGTSARDEVNALSSQLPLFDRPVKIPLRRRTIADTIDLLCRALALQSHNSVSVGVSPRSVLAYATVKTGGGMVSARELLIQSLKAAPRDVYWCLLFDPTSKGYVLNLHTSKS